MNREEKNKIAHIVRNVTSSIQFQLRKLEEMCSSLKVSKHDPILINPTGNPVRNTDDWGSGYFGAPRRR